MTQINTQTNDTLGAEAIRDAINMLDCDGTLNDDKDIANILYEAMCVTIMNNIKDVDIQNTLYHEINMVFEVED